ncbi:30S ribosomal protein S8 [Candidatus Woesearchaeota archaeon]|nr:30S ribosomal protein S8 [Candidatus Woesearchaeota archaeon]MBW2978536.1 30S ribosomal protein S8 [Candidatus Woesearchaeota archaeon]
MMNDTLAVALSAVNNYDRSGKKVIVINPSSKVIKDVLKIFNEQGFIGSFEKVSDSKGGFLRLNLLGNINKCGVIKPRFAVKSDEFEKFEKRYLPAKGVGILIVSTNKGLMTHHEALDKRIGGRLIAYCY